MKPFERAILLALANNVPVKILCPMKDEFKTLEFKAVLRLIAYGQLTEEEVQIG